MDHFVFFLFVQVLYRLNVMILLRDYCIFAPILIPNYDFTLTYFHFAFLPLLLGNKTSV